MEFAWDVFSCSSVEEYVSKSSEIYKNTNIRGYYDDLISKGSLYLPWRYLLSTLSFENTVCSQAWDFSSSEHHSLSKEEQSEEKENRVCANEEMCTLNQLEIGNCYRENKKTEAVETVQKEQNNLNAYVHEPVNSENELHTCGNHLGVRIIPCESGTSLALEMLCDKCMDSPNPFITYQQF